MGKPSVMRTFLCSSLAIGLAGLLFVGVYSGGESARRKETAAQAEAQHYSAGEGEISVTENIREIKIDWVSGSVVCRVYDGDQLTFSESAGRVLSQDQTLRYQVKDGRLKIDFMEAGRGFRLFDSVPAKDLEVWIPASLGLETLSIDSVSGAVSVEGGGMRLREADVETVSGGVEIDNLYADEASVSSVSGGITLGGGFGEIDLESVSGGMTLRLFAMPRSVRAESISGGVDLALPENDGFTARLESISGRLRSDFEGGEEKNRVQYKNGGAELRFETVSGGVSLRRDASLAAPTATPVPEATEDAGAAALSTPVPSSQRSF